MVMMLNMKSTSFFHLRSDSLSFPFQLCTVIKNVLHLITLHIVSNVISTAVIDGWMCLCLYLYMFISIFRLWCQIIRSSETELLCFSVSNCNDSGSDLMSKEICNLVSVIISVALANGYWFHCIIQLSIRFICIYTILYNSIDDWFLLSDFS